MPSPLQVLLLLLATLQGFRGSGPLASIVNMKAHPVPGPRAGDRQLLQQQILVVESWIQIGCVP